MMHALLSCVCESLLLLSSFRCGLRFLGQVLSNGTLEKMPFFSQRNTKSSKDLLWSYLTYPHLHQANQGTSIVYTL